MKIIDHKLIDQNIKITFDTNFKQIRYLKLHGNILHFGELECDEAEIKFTKAKNSLTIYNEDNNIRLIIFIIIEIDNIVCNYSYYINTNKDDNSNNNFDLLGLGITKLLTQEKNEKEIIKELSIKNRNIFANIKRKGT